VIKRTASHVVSQETPAVQLVTSLLNAAIAVSASDIHLDPTHHGLQIRFRIDGILYTKETIEQSLMNQVVARLKVLAHIDIAEKRVPQDGKFILVHEAREIDCRVSTFPVMHGEKVVIRILNRAAQALSFEQLGFPSTVLAQVQEHIQRASGFFLVAGPTGSGKTTTLYAALSTLNGADRHIITLENPIEYNIAGITQGQINPEVGFTFEKGMRALLRQDPDVVMVGEIRDKQTARIAIEASLTGHMVFSTIHTTDAPSVLMRLMDMQIEPFLLNASLTGILAQRLARKICAACRIPAAPTAQEKTVLAQIGCETDVLFKGAGCDACAGLGYKGRTGIFQLLLMNNAMRSLLVQHPSFDRIVAQAQNDGMQTLLYDGARKVADGTITVQELLRVV
jgi:type II secretory ATPase GspE/PulE/Tfp pilus assembly ATPase PilB-like protein